jgi:hypothetical protein
VTRDWRDFRPAIWLAMAGVALFALLNPYIGVVVLGASIGVALRIERRRRHLRAPRPGGRARRSKR